MYKILLLRIFLPLVDGYEKLPHYYEYLYKLGKERREHMLKTPTSTPCPDEVAPLKLAGLPPTELHSIPLCKELPKDAGIYAHVFCWSMVALFSLTVISLIIYQLRSILWLRLIVANRKQRKGSPQNPWKDITLSPLVINEQFADKKNTREHRADETDIPRVLPV